MKPGVLLFNLGGPERLSDVKPFLYRLFSDPEIVRVKWTPLRKALAYAIATVRHKTSAGYYRQIGGGSPLRRLTEEQARALAEALKSRGKDVQTFVGMCTWHPFLDEAVENVQKSDVDHLVILPLFPQYSVTTTGSGFAVLRRLLDRAPALRKLNIQWIRSWPDQPRYVESFAKMIRRELQNFADPGTAHVLFSAHSIPERYVREGDSYLEETKKTVELVMDRLERRNPYQLSFQSKIGPVKWLEPFTSDVITALGKQGIHDLLVVPISFVSEHIETLYELDILFQKIAHDAGIRNFRRVPALNSDPTFIQALAEIVESAL